MTIDLRPDQRIKVDGSESIYRIMREILIRESIIDQDKEHLWVVGLSNSLHILYIELVCLGTYKSVQVEPMEVFSWALQKRCAKIILVHNHPGNDLKPSNADKDVTDRLIQVGKIIQLDVIDHLIITTESYYSFVDDGLMNELEGSTKFVPPFVLVESLKEEADKLRKQIDTVRDERNKEIAKTLLADGVDLNVIANATGLKLEYLKRLLSE